MNLGGDDWPIYLEPSGEVGKKGVRVDLKPGDMLVYKGDELKRHKDRFSCEISTTMNLRISPFF